MLKEPCMSKKGNSQEINLDWNMLIPSYSCCSAGRSLFVCASLVNIFLHLALMPYGIQDSKRLEICWGGCLLNELHQTGSK